MAATPLSKAELEELKKLYREIEGLDRDRAKSAAEHAASIGRAASELDRLRQEYRDMSDDISYAAKGFKSIVQEITNQNIGVKESIKGYNKLSSIAEKIQSYQRGVSELSSKDIIKLKDQVKQEKVRLENAQDLLKDKKSSLSVDKTNIDSDIKRLGIEIRRKRSSGESARAEINQIQRLQKSLEKNAFQQKQIQESLSQNAAIISDQDQLFKGLNVTLDRTLEQTQNLEKALGLGGNAAKGIEKTLNNIGLGDLSSKLGLDEVNKKMKETADRITEGGEKAAGFGGKVRVLGAGIAEMGKQLAKGLLDPLAILGFLLKGFLALDKAQTEFTRETGHSIDMVDTLNTSLISSADYIKAATELTKQFGLAADAIFTKETLQEATEMVELMGLASEETGKLARLSKISGTELKANNEKIMASYSNFVKLNKSGISAKSVFKDVANVSSTIAMSFKGNTVEIAKSVMEARKLGLSLEQVDKVAESLLNFEDSISAELEAELLTGKQINLEQARLYALNNDIAGLTKEIGNNQAIIESFSSGNRIQQEAIAKTLGMSREEMSKMIYDQQITNGLTEEQAAKLADVSLEDMKRLSIQESINKSIEKMSEALAGPLSMLAEMLSHSTVLYGIMGAIGIIIANQIVASTIAFGKSLAPIITKLTSILTLESGIAAAKMAVNPYLLVAGAAAAVGVGALIGSAMSKTPKLAEGGTVLGEGAIMVGEEGPEIMTAKPGATVTPLKSVNAAKTGGGGEGNNTTILNEIKNLLQQIASTPGTVMLDGAKIGTALTPFVNQTNVQTQVKTGANI